MNQAQLLTARHAVDDVYSEAVYSPCQRFRYSLVRRFGKRKAVKAERIAFIGLNPSTATEVVNDPTVRRCIGYARDWGFREFVMLNAFGFRSTDPKGLRSIPEPVGPENDRQIRDWVRKSSLAVCCWGVHAELHQRHEAVIELLSRTRTPVRCFGSTLAGFPKHPLYLRKDAELAELPVVNRSAKN